MKLFYSSTSPYVRKVLACAIALEIEGKIELVPADPHASPAALVAANPLSKVPCLLTDDGVALFDSPVICEYLDALSDSLPLIPKQGSVRWRVLRQQALGDGIMDAAVAYRQELARTQDEVSEKRKSRWLAAITRSLDWLEANTPKRTIDIGGITVACAIGYLDFRLANEPWRASRPKLAEWYQAFSEIPPLARTVPKERT